MHPRQILLCTLVLCLCLAVLTACEKTPADKALTAMENGDFTTAIRWYMEAVRANPQDKTSRAGLSDARLRYAKQFAIDAVGGMHNGTVDWERLIEHLEQEGENVRMELLDAYYNLAQMYRKAGDPDRALEVLMKAAGRDPSRRIPVGKIADLVKARKDAAWGKRAFDALTQRFPEDQEVCAKFGAYLATFDLWDEAIARYRSCLKLNPGDFTYNNDVRSEIQTLEKRKQVRADRFSPQ